MKRQAFVNAFLGLVGAFILCAIYFAYVEDRRVDREFNAMPPARHVAKAKEAILIGDYGGASRHLKAVPPNAPEREEAVRLLVDTYGKEQELHRQLQQPTEEGHTLSSYWPTTIRVQTDMNSFWLDQEERVCASYPDERGRILSVHCDNNERPDSHNIPVTFFGSVDRGKSSSWKCRRETEKFVCRAIN